MVDCDAISPAVGEVEWAREGDDWVLWYGNRKVGRVFRDGVYPQMWRSRRADGKISDMANLSWAKFHVLAVAEREIEYEKAQEKRPPPEPNASSIRFTNGGGQ